MPSAFDCTYVTNIDAGNVQASLDKRSMIEAIRADINRFRDEKRVDRLVMIYWRSKSGSGQMAVLLGSQVPWVAQRSGSQV